MATNNPTWGEERIANELLLKIGIRISPRTVRRYMPEDPKRPKAPTQRWMTFVHNHAKAIIAADFFIVVTATFRLVYVFVVMEIGTRRVLHFNVTRHPTTEWELQEFRECLTGEDAYRFVIHDRDARARWRSVPLPRSDCSLPSRRSASAVGQECEVDHVGVISISKRGGTLCDANGSGCRV